MSTARDSGTDRRRLTLTIPHNRAGFDRRQVLSIHPSTTMVRMGVLVQRSYVHGGASTRKIRNMPQMVHQSHEQRGKLDDGVANPTGTPGCVCTP